MTDNLHNMTDTIIEYTQHKLGTMYTIHDKDALLQCERDDTGDFALIPPERYTGEPRSKTDDEYARYYVGE